MEIRPLLSVLVVVLAAGACERNVAELPARDHAGAEVAALPTSAEAATDPRDVPAPDFGGRPIWSANSQRTAEENARAAFERNGAAFQAANFEDFVAKAHAFTGAPPEGAETLKRANGDTLIYDPAGNVFAVVTAEGAPRTMFRPDAGAAYWEEQKRIEAERVGG